MRSMIWTGTRRKALSVALCFGLFGIVTGCGPSGPGLEDKPPPKGGPSASSRRPPGEVDNKNTR